MKTELEESHDHSHIQQELRAKREEELQMMKVNKLPYEVIESIPDISVISILPRYVTETSGRQWCSLRVETSRRQTKIRPSACRFE